MLLREKHDMITMDSPRKGMPDSPAVNHDRVPFILMKET